MTKEAKEKESKLPRVTAIIDVELAWNKRVLINWAKNIGKEAADATLKIACENGTCAHDYIENHIFGATIDASKYSMEAIVIGKQAEEAIIELEKQLEITWIESELSVETDRYRGTLDCLFTMPFKWEDYGGGKGEWVRVEVPVLYLGDFKTSKRSTYTPTGIYKEHIVQLGAYNNALVTTTDYRPEGFCFFHIDKEIKADAKPEDIIQMIPMSREKIEIGAKIFDNCVNNYYLKNDL